MFLGFGSLPLQRLTSPADLLQEFGLDEFERARSGLICEMPARHSDREFERRYRYRGWFYADRARGGATISSEYRHRVNRLLKTTDDFQGVPFPLPPKTGGWLTR